MTPSDFDLQYGKNFSQHLFNSNNTLFLRIVSVSIVLTLLIIITLANLQFENLNEDIKNKYQQYASSLTPEILVKENAIQEEQSGKSSIQRKAAKPIDSGFQKRNKIEPSLKILEIDELSYELNAEGEAKLTIRRSRNNQERIDWDGLMDNPYDYKIERNANLYIEAPAGQSAETETYGYRDQEEVYRVIDTKSINIESCYEKAVRFGLNKKGYIKLQFKITSDGFILPQSVRIIESTLRNKRIEQCIKKNIRRLRGFAKLDESKGTARVTHKFVFN